MSPRTVVTSNMEKPSHRGIYVCVNPACSQRNKEIRRIWHESWPLKKRQHACPVCGRRMLFVAIRKQMTAEAKKRLREARKRAEV